MSKIILWSHGRSMTQGVRVTDAAWPVRLAASSREIALLRACDGRETIDRILRSFHLPPPERADALVSLQRLVDDGVLCPRARPGPGPPPRSAAGADRR